MQARYVTVESMDERVIHFVRKLPLVLNMFK